MAISRLHFPRWLAALLLLPLAAWAQDARVSFQDVNYAASDDLQGALKRADEWRAQASAKGDKALMLAALRLATRALCDRMDGGVASLKRDLAAGLPLARELGNAEAEVEFLIWSADLLARERNPDPALTAFDASIALAEARGLADHAAYARAFKARVHINRLNRAADGMSELVKAYAHFEKQHDRVGMGLTSFMMGWVFQATSEKDAATKVVAYFQRALEHLDPARSRNYVAYVHWFLGGQYRRTGDLAWAREHFTQSLALRRQLADPGGAANIELQLASMDLNEGKPGQALVALEQILAVFESTGETFFQFNTLLTKIRALTALNRQQEAAEALERARALAAKINTPFTDTNISGAAMRFYEHFKEYEQAYKESMALRKAEQVVADQNRMTEIVAIERREADRNKEKMQRKELELAESRRVAQLELAESRRVSQLVTLAAVTVLILALAGLLLLRGKRRAVERANARLEEQVAARTSELDGERKRAEGLLRNTLPDAVIAELKSTGKVSSLRHESVSVMFSDFVGFTTASSTMPPDRLLVELSDIFGGFDAIAETHGLEKIKTIGDSYMSVAGLHREVGNHAEACVRAAREMLAFMERRNAGSAFKWQLRLGIHSGPVIAGVVGTSRFAFDIWGDTVNLASRMESVGTPGTITVSAYTADLLQGKFEREHRGKLEVKGKGALDVYMVKVS